MLPFFRSRPTKRGNELPPIDTIPVGVHSVGRHGSPCWPGAADHPVAAIFRYLLCRPSAVVHTPLLGGRRLTRAVGQAAFCGYGSSSPPQRLPPPTPPVNCCAAHQSASVIFSRRSAVALQPRTADPSPAPRMLRPRSAWRFALASRLGTAHLAVRVRVEAIAKGIAPGVCRLRSCLPGRSAQPSLQPTALSL
jgi:hypothetical protein